MKFTALRNSSGLEFIDISSEVHRSYKYKDGSFIDIVQPVALHVSDSGAHRVLDSAGNSYYIPVGWFYLVWQAYPDGPHFVK